MGFIVQIGDRHFVKRTARFGPFHGRVVCTDQKHEARVWTREKDARKAGRVVGYHRRQLQSMYERKPLPTGNISIEVEPLVAKER